MINEIEKAIRKYFPRKWSEKDIVLLIGEPRFKIDLMAANGSLNSPLRDLIFRGGKRWRPMLFLASLDLFGLNWKKYLDLAVFIEIIHSGSLIIDDIEDNSSLRRGRPACYKIFGVNTALNAGNAAYFLLLKRLRSKKIAKNEELRLWQIYGEEMNRGHFGQALDIFWRNNKKTAGKNEYLEMCRLKTGCLVRMAARMACVLAGKNKNFEKDFARLAESAAVAFQIKDDILDSAADKKFAGDFVGKSAGRFAGDLLDEAWANMEPELPKNKKLEKFKELIYLSVKRNK